MEVGNFPSWARSVLKPEDLPKISEAVRRAEMKTTGEIVPVIVHRSSVVGHVPLMFTLVFLVLLLVFEVPQLDVFEELNAYWFLFFVAVGSFALAQFVSRSMWVQRIFVPVGDQAIQVEERALIEFYQQGIGKTAENTGILLFLSVMERRAVVLADEAIARRLPKEAWHQVCATLVEGIKHEQTAEALIAAIHKSGELLALHFPAHKENQNELSNQLILKE